MRVLGLDVGEKTVGVAVSDPMGWTAQPVETIRFKTPSEAFSRLAALIEELGVEEIVCGLPLNMNGTEGPQAAFVRKFMEGVVKKLSASGKNLPIHLRDERLSTIGAERVLLEADLSRAKRKKVIDKMAACFILQGYLESIRR